MTRRLTLVILATVAATLLVAGGGHARCSPASERASTPRTSCARRPRDLAASIDDLNNQGALRLLANLRNTLNLEGIEVMRFGPAGRTVDQYPAGVPAVRHRPRRAAQRRDGERQPRLARVRGRAGERQPQGAERAETCSPWSCSTREADTPLRPATGWFLLAAIATLGIGALVAWRFGRRLTRPLREARGGHDGASPPAICRPGCAVAKPGSKDELTSLAESINAMAETLERSKGLERQFLLSVSHDLRTPLTSIQGYAEAIADGALPDAAEGGAVILSEARRLDRLVDDLLDLAKLESRQFSMTLEPVDLADVVAATVDGFRPEADDASIALELRAPQEPITVQGDTDRLAQVTGNLVQNALKYARSRIVVSRWRHRRMGPARRHGRRSGHRGRRPTPRVRAALRRPPATGAPGDRLGARPGHRPRAGRPPCAARCGRPRPRREDVTMAGACLSVFLPFGGPPVSSAPAVATATSSESTS